MAPESQPCESCFMLRASSESEVGQLFQNQRPCQAQCVTSLNRNRMQAGTKHSKTSNLFRSKRFELVSGMWVW